MDQVIHNKSSYLSDYENNRIIDRLIGSSNCKVLSTVNIEIYSLEEFQWLRKDYGFLCFTEKSSSNDVWYSIYFLNINFDVKWKKDVDEIESYTKLTSYFDYFTTKNHIIGLNFSYDDEAEKFYMIVNQFIIQKLRNKTSSMRIQIKPACVDQVTSPSYKSIFRRNLKKNEISPPTNFRVLQHIGFQRNDVEVSLNEESNGMIDIISEMFTPSRVITKTINDLKFRVFKINNDNKNNCSIPPAPEQFKLIHRRKNKNEMNFRFKKSLSPRLSEFLQNSNKITLDDLKLITMQYIDEETFENTKLSEIFKKYLPKFNYNKISNDLILAFSINELRVLVKVDNEKLFKTELDNIKLLITEGQSHDFQEVIQIKKENTLKQNAEDKLCKICMELPMDCVYFECKHICSCMSCAEKINKCPICRQQINQRVKVIIS